MNDHNEQATHLRWTRGSPEERLDENHFGTDPAMATGIFITTGNDILAVLVFFLAATLIYLLSPRRAP